MDLTEAPHLPILDLGMQRLASWRESFDGRRVITAKGLEYLASITQTNGAGGEMNDAS